MSATRYLREQAAALVAAGRLAEAAAAYGRLLALVPKDFEANHQLGTLKVQLGAPEDGRKLLDTALGVDPRRAETWLHRGMALQNLGRAAEAAADYRRTLEINPDLPEALFLLGQVLRHLRQGAEALTCYDRCAALSPYRPSVFQQRGELRYEQGDMTGALADFDTVLQLQPDMAQAWLSRGVMLANLGRSEEAVSALDRALVLAPRHADIHYNRGVALEPLGREIEALAAYDQALALAPGHVSAWSNRGNLLRKTAHLDEAIASFRRALALDPSHVPARINRGVALLIANRFEEGAADFRRVMEIAPASKYGASGLQGAALALCDWDTLAQLTPRLEAEAADGRAILSPFQGLLAFSDPRLIHDATAHFRRENESHVVAARPPLRPADGKIRLAYLSADFQAHATAYLMADLFGRHDRTRFEVVGLSFGPSDGSAMRARMAQAFDHFADVQEFSDSQIAQLLRRLEIDIAIDLKGYTLWSRASIFAYRSAPLQVSYLGYPGPMAADYFDYVIADPIVLPHDEQAFYDERIVHLPDCYQVNDPTRAHDPAPSRAAADLPPGGFVFSSFNNHRKIARPIFEVWMRLLAAVPDSLLWLLDDSANDALRAHAKARGINPERLIFAPKVELETHLARIACADLMLDTLPYNAHTTASDALWMGVPLVTCRGTAFAGRVAASLLTAIGLPELITETLEEYEALALTLARDGERLKILKAKLAANRLTAPLFDAERFRRHIEAAYVTMIEFARAGEAPRPFDVPAID